MAKNLILIDKLSGQVTETIFGFNDRTYEPSVYSRYVPYVLDSSIPLVSVFEVFKNFGGAGDTYSAPITLPPTTEQKLTGPMFGQFNRGELLFQSTLHPTVVNNLVLSGATAVAYNPTVVANIGVSSGTIVGQKCAQFKGSYLDTDTQAACLRIPDYTYPGSSMSYFMASGFMYLSSTPSGAYDPIVLAKTTSGTAGTVNDSFQLEYDNSATRMLLMVSSNSYPSAGFEYTVNASPTGVSLNQWHHFAFAYSNQGNSACVSTYWNGTRIAKQTGLSGNIRFNSAPFSIGGGPHGNKPLKGYLDDIIVSGGTSSTALRGIAHGTTCTVPTTSQSSGEYTVWHTTLHGPEGESMFPVSGPSKVISTHMYTNTDPDVKTTNLYVGTIDAIQDSVHGLSLFSGISTGHILYVEGGSAGYVFGYDSGACLIPTSVVQLKNLAEVKTVKSSLADNTQLYLLGSAAMRGATGASGDFPKLYSTGVSGGAFSSGPFSFLPTKQNIEDLRTLYDGVVLSGASAMYTIFSADGISYQFSKSAVIALYSDVAGYYTYSYQDTASTKAAVSGSSSFVSLRQIEGLSRGSFVQKLAAQVTTNSPSFTISAVSKTTKVYTKPESTISAAEIVDIISFGKG
jgi:hypothetical protein